MQRYCSHTVISPDKNYLCNFVVEVGNCVDAYYPFAGESHSTIYVDTPILLSHRADLEGKTISLAQLTWAMQDIASGNSTLYAYVLTPCDACAGERFLIKKL